jgi:hypothetical protein
MENLSYCTQLYRYDQFIQRNSFLCKEPIQQQKELEEKLLKLKQLEYYYRYGDYLAREWKRKITRNSNGIGQLASQIVFVLGIILKLLKLEQLFFKLLSAAE